MADDFDPYYKWLGIAPEDQPPNHYQLLGVRNFESDPDVLGNSADKQMSHLRSFQGGKRAELSQKVLNEVSAARLCLLNADKKKAYDTQLRKELDAGQPQEASKASGKSGLRAPTEVKFEGKKAKKAAAGEQQIPSPTSTPTTPMPELTPLAPLKGDDAFEDPAIDAVVIPDEPSASGILNRGSGIRQQTAPRPQPAARPATQPAAAGGSAIRRGPALPAESRLVYIIIGSVIFLMLTAAGALMANSLSRGASSLSGMITGAGRRTTPAPPPPRPALPPGTRPGTAIPRPVPSRPVPPRPRPGSSTAFPATRTVSTRSDIQFFWPPAAQRSGQVRMDGQRVNPSISGSTATLNVSPGRHTLSWQRRSFATRTLTVDATAGETQTVHGDWQTNRLLIPSISADLAGGADVGVGQQDWTRRGSMLTSPVVLAQQVAVSGIDRTPPEEYVIDIRAVREKGTGPLQIGLEQGGQRFSILFGGPGGIAVGSSDTGYQTLQPPGPDLFLFGRPVGLRIYVAPGYVGVETRVGQLRNYKGDFSVFQREPKWETSTPLSVGVENSGFRILSLRMYTGFE